MNRYENFDLELAAHRRDDDGETLTARVLDSPAGGQLQSEAQTARFPRRLRERLERLEQRNLDLEQIIELGEELSSLLLPPAAREFYRRSRAALRGDAGLRIRIRADSPALAQLPWEYAYVGRVDTPSGRKGPEGFLALDRTISLVRFEVLPEPTLTGMQKNGAGLRVVTVLADVRDPGFAALDLAQEELNLRQALEDVDDVDARFLRPGRLEQLEEALADGAEVFHFGGHGRQREEMGEEPGTVEGHGELILSGDDGRPAPLAAERLAQELRGRGVRLAVLGACEAARRDATTPWSGVAPALVRQGIPAVVGMLFTVRDGNAVAFSRRFYRALAAGKSVDTAVSDGRLGVFNRAGAAERDWGVPALYLRTERSVLFPLPLAPVRRNLALALAAIVMLSIWFYLHIFPLVAAGATRWLGQVGLGIGAAAGLLAFWKTLASITARTLPQRQQGSWSDRWLRHRHARKVLVPLLALALLLISTTSSVYLEITPGDEKSVELALDTPAGDRWNALPSLSVSAQPDRTLAGGPVFFKLPPPLTVRVVDPAASRVAGRKAQVLPRPWRSVRLGTADVVSEELRLVRIAPRSNLMSKLAPPGDAMPVTVYSLSVKIDDQEPGPDPIGDLRQGVVVLGGPAAVLKSGIGQETIDERREALAGCLVMRTPQSEQAMMALWQPEADNRRQYLATPLIGAGQSLKIEVFIPGDPDNPIASKTVKPEQLKANQINTICLSAGSDAP